jgi:large subunit ribosomal protein L17
MRHGRKVNHLGRTSAHRKAMMSNMATSLIMHKRISTTVAKAKALRKYVEPLITKAKNDTTHSRRMVFSYLQDKNAVTELFREVSQKVGDRPGGYTRILRTGFRIGDAAEMCIIELVDYNESYSQNKGGKTAAKKSTRRSGSRGKKKEEVEATIAAKETPKVEETVQEQPQAEATIAEDILVENVESTIGEMEGIPNLETAEEESNKEE